MLIVTRRAQEAIIIGDNVHVTVLSVKGDQVRLGVSAPREVPVDRLEIRVRKDADGSNKVMAVACPT